MTCLALVEDNEDLRDELAFQLTRAGFDVVECADGQELDRCLAATPCRLIVLDLGLPGEDGLSIAARLRQNRPDLGVVMLTARSQLSDRLTGLDRGADAYLVKPVDVRELIAVIHTIRRRLDPAARNHESNGWRLHHQALEIITPLGTPIPLSGMEATLLRQLAKTAPEVATRRALIEALGHNYLIFDPRRLDTAMSRLRTKLEAGSPAGSPIRAIRGVGYLFTMPLCEIPAQLSAPHRPDAMAGG